MKSLMMVALIAAAAIAFTGCKKEETAADKLNKALENTSEAVTDAAKKAADATADAAAEAQKKLEDAVNK